MYIPASEVQAGRAVTLQGVSYVKGEPIPVAALRKLPRLGALLSKRVLVPVPDTHARRTKTLTPTPTNLVPGAIPKSDLG